MRKYETVIVLSPDLNDSQVKQEIGKYETIIQNKGGKNITVEPWGKKDLAHATRRFKSGRYVCLKYETADHSTVETITGLLRISDAVIKHQSHLISDKVRKFRGNPKRAGRPGAFDFDYGDSSDQLDADY